jgi:hypothetical protein
MGLKNKKSITAKEIMSLLEKHSDTLRDYKVKRIGLFGSHVRGKQKKTSDIDLIVEFDHSEFDSNYTGYFDNYEGLLSFLRKMLNRKIDLLTNDMISPHIKPYVLKEVEYIETS